MLLKFLTYNIHYGIGRDRRYDLDRIIEVIRQEDPDVVGLQEVDNNLARTGFDNQSRIIADALSMHFYHCINRRFQGGEFGITTLSKFPLHDVQRFDLSYRYTFREPRGTLRTDIILNSSRRLHFFNVHLGHSSRERYYQRRKLLSPSILFDQTLMDPMAVLGDFNDRPIPLVHSKLRNHFVDSFSATGTNIKSTYFLGPIGFKLDRIYFDRNFQVVESYVVKSRLAYKASDHLPLVSVARLN